MTKIAVISTMSSFPWGGSECLWASMAEQALLEEHEVLISIFDWSVNEAAIIKLQQKGVQLSSRKRSSVNNLISIVYKRVREKISTLKTSNLRSKYQDILDWKPDIICINQGHVYEAIYDSELVNCLNKNSIPYLILSHLNEDSFKLNGDTIKNARKLFMSAIQNVFVSCHNWKLTERQLALVLPNSRVIQNPVNLLDFSIVPWPEVPIICFASVSRLEVGFKGQDILLEVLSFPRWQQRNWQYNIYGAGPDRDYLEALANHYGIGHRIKFMDHVGDIRSIWQENHILLLPSRAEGTPLALIEAMLCARPTVVTDVGGNAEWINEGETGFIAAAPTTKSFDSALDRAWISQENWQKIGIKAHEYVTAKLDYHPGKTLLKLIISSAINTKKR